jgi:hypothetical protein
LYLLIVNIPTDEEMAEAIQIMDQAQQQAAYMSGSGIGTVTEARGRVRRMKLRLFRVD